MFELLSKNGIIALDANCLPDKKQIFKDKTFKSLKKRGSIVPYKAGGGGLEPFYEIFKYLKKHNKLDEIEKIQNIDKFKDLLYNIKELNSHVKSSILTKCLNIYDELDFFCEYDASSNYFSKIKEEKESILIKKIKYIK